MIDPRRAISFVNPLKVPVFPSSRAAIVPSFHAPSKEWVSRAVTLGASLPLKEDDGDKGRRPRRRRDSHRHGLIQLKSSRRRRQGAKTVEADGKPPFGAV